jgi:hypothetical protein
VVSSALFSLDPTQWVSAGLTPNPSDGREVLCRLCGRPAGTVLSHCATADRKKIVIHALIRLPPHDFAVIVASAMGRPLNLMSVPSL